MNKTDKSQNISESGVSAGSVAIVGAGLVGRGWAIVFAHAGWQVKLYDLDVGALDDAKKEIPGFILNRLQSALLNKALRLVPGGYVTLDDVDKTMRDGLGLRWSFMEPFETIDLNAPTGLADYARRYGRMYHVMAASQSTPPNWDKSSVAGIDATRQKTLKHDDIGQRQDWRDNRLAAPVAHKSKQEN